jgi:hypothetical protein
MRPDAQEAVQPCFGLPDATLANTPRSRTRTKVGGCRNGHQFVQQTRPPGSGGVELEAPAHTGLGVSAVTVGAAVEVP